MTGRGEEGCGPTFFRSQFLKLGSYHFLAHGGGGGWWKRGDQVKIIDKKGDQVKNNVIEGGIKHFCSTASKKKKSNRYV